MKYIIFFLCFIGIITMLGVYMLTTPVFEKSNTSSYTVSQENLKNHVKFLTQSDIERSYQHIDRLNEVSSYIFDHFTAVGCDTVEYQKYQARGEEHKNVMCRFSGKDQERMIIGAHYDVDASNYHDDDIGNSLFRGADDNASGVSGLLELATLMGEAKEDDLSHTVELVAYTLEEVPGYHTESMGSYVHAKNLKENNISVKYMISLEMIGYFTSEKVQQYPISILKLLYPKTGDFIALIGKAGSSKQLRNIKKSMIQGSKIDVYSMNSPDFVPGINRSDHWSYWKHGYEAYLLTDTSYLRNPNYHKISDTIDTLDFGKVAQVVSSVYNVIKK